MKNQKGGLLHYLHEKIIENFVSPADGFNSDCCPCVFNLLGIEEELFKILQNAARNRGMYDPEIVEQLKIYFEQEKGYDLNNIDIEVKNVTSDEELSEVLDSIPTNYGIFAGYGRTDNTGHCILIGKINDTLTILDPQNYHDSTFGFDNVMYYLQEQQVNEISFYVFRYKDTGEYVRSFQRLNERGIILENYINLDINIPDLVDNEMISFSLPKNSKITVDDMNKFWDTINYTEFLKIDKNRGCSINVLTYLGIIRTYAEGDVLVSLLNNNNDKNEVIYPGAANMYNGLLDHPGALNFSEILAILQDNYSDKLINKKDNTIFKLKELKYNFLEDDEMNIFLNSNDYTIPYENGEMYYQRFILLLEYIQSSFMNNHFAIVKFNRKCIPGSTTQCQYGHTQILYKKDDELYIIDPQVVKIYNTSEKLKTEEGRTKLTKLYIDNGYIGASFVSGSWENYDEYIKQFMEYPFIEVAESKLEKGNIESWIGDENIVDYVKRAMEYNFPESLYNLSLSQFKWRLFDLYEKQTYKDVPDVNIVLEKTVNHKDISKVEWEKFFSYLYSFGGKNADDRYYDSFYQKWVEDLPNNEILDYLLSKDVNYNLGNIKYNTEEEDISELDKTGGTKNKKNKKIRKTSKKKFKNKNKVRKTSKKKFKNKKQ